MYVYFVCGKDRDGVVYASISAVRAVVDFQLFVLDVGHPLSVFNHVSKPELYTYVCIIEGKQ